MKIIYQILKMHWLTILLTIGFLSTIIIVFEDKKEIRLEIPARLTTDFR